MVRTEIGFDAVLTKIGSKFKPEIDDVVIEFSLRFVDRHDVQSFLDSYEKKCSLSNISSLFMEPVQWKTLHLDANYRFKMDFDELNDLNCILKAIKVRRKYSAKDMSDVYTYDLLFEKNVEDGDQDWTFTSYLNRKEEDEEGKKNLMEFRVHLEAIESVSDYVEVDEDAE